MLPTVIGAPRKSRAALMGRKDPKKPKAAPETCILAPTSVPTPSKPADLVKIHTFYDPPVPLMSKWVC